MNRANESPIVNGASTAVSRMQIRPDTKPAGWWQQSGWAPPSARTPLVAQLSSPTSSAPAKHRDRLLTVTPDPGRDSCPDSALPSSLLPLHVYNRGADPVLCVVVCDCVSWTDSSTIHQDTPRYKITLHAGYILNTVYLLNVSTQRYVHVSEMQDTNKIHAGYPCGIHVSVRVIKIHAGYIQDI